MIVIFDLQAKTITVDGDNPSVMQVLAKVRDICPTFTGNVHATNIAADHWIPKAMVMPNETDAERCCRMETVAKCDADQLGQALLPEFTVVRLEGFRAGYDAAMSDLAAYVNREI